MNNRLNLKSTFLILLVCALWGTLYPFTQICFDVFGISSSFIPSIILFVGIRFAICGTVPIVISSIKNKKVDIIKKSELLPVFYGILFSIVLQYAFTYIGISIGDSSKSAIIKQIGFLLITGFAFVFDKEDTFSIKKLLAGIIGFAGVFVTSIEGRRFNFNISDVLMLLSSFCAVIGTVIKKKNLQKGFPLLRSTGWGQLIGGVFLIFTGIILGGEITVFTPISILVLLYVCGASIIADLIWSYVLKNNNISRMSVIKFFEPLFAVLFSGILLGEEIFKFSYGIALLLIFIANLIQFDTQQNKKIT